jgi:CheY-like chemotaxis protein
MRKSAAVLCQDKRSLQTLQSTLNQLGIELMNCRTQQEALELVMTGRCTTLIVDFDLAGADEVVRMAALLPPAQKPALLALETRVWPGTGQAFQSGASRILYKPIDSELIKGALKTSRAGRTNRRKWERHEVKTLVYLELTSGTIPGISVDIGEHGLALQATEIVPMSSNVAFRCVLPGTHVTLHGHAEVIWTSDHGRAGLFFSKLAPVARKQLKHWISRHGSRKDSVRELLPPADEHVDFAHSEEQLAEVL